MAIIVDKDKKRKDIAIACTELLLEKGIKNLTVSEIANTAGIGKGTVYDYFANKEAVVFEIIRGLMNDHQKDLNARIDDGTSCRQKILYLFDFVLCEFKDYTKHMEVFKEYISVTLSCKSEAMYAFNNECRDFALEIVNEIVIQGIKKGELIIQAEKLILGLLACERGFIFMNWTENKNYKKELEDYINTLFDLIEIKK